MHHMFKKYYLLAIGLFLFIPVVAKSGGMLFELINPDIANR